MDQKDDFEVELVEGTKYKDKVKEDLDQIDELVQKLNSEYEAEKKEAREYTRKIDKMMESLTMEEKAVFKIH